ncbi:E3 ubiquitin-protein ligase RNF10 [Anopheles bellator]|uniref:E3 ubiquitin-protein ligase RNF10 n=1 Tax=Anopheles bellator TaxID=139047 RepID=UPI00264A2847|nr:E3 ubiquitin-protein ligase RNF10 [Anopheles bellator]
MEKNRFVNQSLSKGQLSETKKNQDASVKWPRQSKRRGDQSENGNHRNATSNGSRAANGNKTRNPSNYNYDARQRASQRPAKPPEQQIAPSYDDDDDDETGDQLGGEGSAGRTTGLATSTRSNLPMRGGGELHSVFSPGSKKQSLNHLLNFHYAPRERDQPARLSRTGNVRRTQYTAQHHSYNKEQFLQANCQFVVRAGENYDLFRASPDQLVEWSKIEQIHVLSAEEPQCPICLYPPVAAKMTKCGHVYCWPCILHYLALSDKAWRKCPICYDAIHLPDLRSAVSKPFHAYGTGEYVTLQLMRREKGSMNVVEVTGGAANGTDGSLSPTTNDQIPHFDAIAGNSTLTKLLLTDTVQMFKIMDRERVELQNQIVADGGADAPENIFVQQALDLLAERRNVLMAAELIEFPASRNALATTPKSDDGDSVSSQADSEETNGNARKSTGSNIASIDFIIDEENNFSVSDIEIVPTAQCAGEHYYFYQSVDGQPLFLHSINSRMLQSMYGSLDRGPRRVTGRVVQKDSCSMDENLRRRLKYLQHLPVCTQFEVVELDFEASGSIVSAEVMAQFQEELATRRRNRQRRERAEQKREKKIFEFNERQLGKAMARSARISIDSTKHFPMCGSVESPENPSLLGTSPVASDVSNSPGSSASSWSKMVSTQPSPSQRWPALGVDNAPVVAPPKIVQVTGRSMTAGPSSSHGAWHLRPPSDIDDDEDDEDAARAPRFNNSLGSAIEAALEQATHKSQPKSAKKLQPVAAVPMAPSASAVNTSSSNVVGKRKKSKKILLVASGVNL